MSGTFTGLLHSSIALAPPPIKRAEMPSTYLPHRFTSRGPTRGNCTSAQQAFASGHELATHTATHPT